MYSEKKLILWLQCDLKGRIVLAKAEGLSKLTNAALALNVDTAILNFVWKNKTHFIRKSVLMNVIEKGV